MSAGASLRPSDAATGGFLDATIATITSARFIDAYPGGKASLLLEVTFQPEGDGAKARTELYRGGSIEEARPNATGSYYAPEAFRMRKDSGAMKFIASVVAAGFDESKLNDDIRVFAGTKVFLRRKALPKFTTKDGTTVEGKDILLVEKVLAMPGEKKVATAVKVAPKAVAAAKVAVVAKAVAETVAPVVANGLEIDAELEAIVSELLAAAVDNTIPRNRIGNLTFQAVIKAKNPRRAPLMALVAQDAFLGGETRPWGFDGENIVGIPTEEAA